MSTTETALALVETMTAVQIFQPGAMDPMLERIKTESRAKAAELDISKEADRKALASLAYQIARSKTFIEARRIELVADEKKRLAAIDAEGRRVREELDALKEEVRRPLTEYEEREKKRVADLEAKVAMLADFGDVGPSATVEAIAALIAKLEAIETADMQEFTQRANLAKSERLTALREHLSAAEQREAERLELERHRKEAAEREQKEREAAIAERARREAEEKAERDRVAERVRLEGEARRREEEAKAAKAEAERQAREAEQRAIRAEQERLEAQAKAEADRKAAEERAKREQEAAIQRERERVAAEEEAKRQEQERREADREHRRKVNSAALKALMDGGVPHDNAVTALTLIAQGKVPNVKLTY